MPNSKGGQPQRRRRSSESRSPKAGPRRPSTGKGGAKSTGSGKPVKKARRRDLQGAAANLPNWVVEALVRVTPDRRVPAALQALGEASEAFADGAYQRALRKGQKAKELAPRDSTIREIVGLAAYRLGDWQLALAELRTFRRLAGETTHLPVEMDALRALGRNDDVESAWQSLQERGGRPAVMKEGRVVYASFLADLGRLDAAWELVAPRRLGPDPYPEDLRLWYVAARIAAMQGRTDDAARLRNAILEHDPGFPGIDDLEALMDRT